MLLQIVLAALADALVCPLVAIMPRGCSFWQTLDSILVSNSCCSICTKQHNISNWQQASSAVKSQLQ